MRRGFSILLIMVFGLGPLSATLQASDDAYLPACCRRNGAHHCAMTTQIMAMMRRMPPDPRPAFDVPLTCPYYPGSAAVLVAPLSALLAAPACLPILSARAVTPLPGSVAVRSIPSGTHSGRGPPAPIQS